MSLSPKAKRILWIAIGLIIVIAPFAGTPAYRAGIHPGDIIAAVDGKATDNMSTADVADLLKGPKGYQAGNVVRV